MNGTVKSTNREKILESAWSHCLMITPMQAPASFNLASVKTQLEEMIKAHEAQ